jgi:hypothetical protein
MGFGVYTVTAVALGLGTDRLSGITRYLIFAGYICWTLSSGSIPEASVCAVVWFLFNRVRVVGLTGGISTGKVRSSLYIYTHIQ